MLSVIALHGCGKLQTGARALVVGCMEEQRAHSWSRFRRCWSGWSRKRQLTAGNPGVSRRLGDQVQFTCGYRDQPKACPLFSRPTGSSPAAIASNQSLDVGRATSRGMASVGGGRWCLRRSVGKASVSGFLCCSAFATLCGKKRPGDDAVPKSDIGRIPGSHRSPAQRAG